MIKKACTHATVLSELYSAFEKSQTAGTPAAGVRTTASLPEWNEPRQHPTSVKCASYDAERDSRMLRRRDCGTVGLR
jgi:hypothetical protein